MGDKPTLKLKAFAELSELYAAMNKTALPASSPPLLTSGQGSVKKGGDLFQRKTRPGVPADWLGEFRWNDAIPKFGESLKVVGYLGPCPVYG